MSPIYSNNRVSEMMLPLLNYLFDETQEKFTLVYTRSYDDHLARCRSGEIDIAYSNAIEYIKLAPRNGLRTSGFKPLVCALLPESGSDRYAGVIAVRADSKINEVSDLKNKKGMYAAQDSFGGYLAQVAALKEIGINARTELNMVEAPSQKQDIAVAALYNGQVDFIFVRDEALKIMSKSLDISKLKIIFETPKIPEWIISVSPKVSPEMAQKIKQALLKIDPSNPKHKGILDAVRISGWKEVSDSDYDPVRVFADNIGVVW